MERTTELSALKESSSFAAVPWRLYLQAARLSRVRGPTVNNGGRKTASVRYSRAMKAAEDALFNTGETKPPAAAARRNRGVSHSCYDLETKLFKSSAILRLCDNS